MRRRGLAVGSDLEPPFHVVTSFAAVKVARSRSAFAAIRGAQRLAPQRLQLARQLGLGQPLRRGRQANKDEAGQPRYRRQRSPRAPEAVITPMPQGSWACVSLAQRPSFARQSSRSGLEKPPDARITGKSLAL